eukprot:TRINITY_DN752_c0_g1_i1.p1 TRINITY_DN752_c0_g1~~TRINITY_DN752_c0_g1_i1.p1  ORF type:complete len:543 (+),score=142.78 TRINITY_DN752_c0_g1_i1:307-1935(+)
MLLSYFSALFCLGLAQLVSLLGSYAGPIHLGMGGITTFFVLFVSMWVSFARSPTLSRLLVAAVCLFIALSFPSLPASLSRGLISISALFVYARGVPFFVNKENGTLVTSIYGMWKPIKVFSLIFFFCMMGFGLSLFVLGGELPSSDLLSWFFMHAYLPSFGETSDYVERLDTENPVMREEALTDLLTAVISAVGTQTQTPPQDFSQPLVDASKRLFFENKQQLKGLDSFFVAIFLALLLLVSNVIVNLLIAMMADVFDGEKENSQVMFQLIRYRLCVEYEAKEVPAYPPPLNVFTHQWVHDFFSPKDGSDEMSLPLMLPLRKLLDFLLSGFVQLLSDRDAAWARQLYTCYFSPINRTSLKVQDIKQGRNSHDNIDCSQLLALLHRARLSVMHAENAPFVSVPVSNQSAMLAPLPVPPTKKGNATPPVATRTALFPPATDSIEAYFILVIKDAKEYVVLVRNNDSLEWVLPTGRDFSQIGQNIHPPLSVRTDTLHFREAAETDLQTSDDVDFFALDNLWDTTQNWKVYAATAYHRAQTATASQ